MSIIRGARPDSNFYVLNKTVSENRAVSWAARGLLIFLLGKPDAWRVSVANLINETASSKKATGRDGIYSLLAELVEAGYMSRTQSRSESGVMGEVDYTVYDTPRDTTIHHDAPLTDNTEAAPLTAQPYTAKTRQVITETSTSNDKNLSYSDLQNLVADWAKPDYSDAHVKANIEFFIDYLKSSKKKYQDYAAACRNAIRKNWANYRGVVTATTKGVIQNDRTRTLDELTGRNRQPRNEIEHEIFASTH
jgi:hypothetical protein